MKQDLNLGWTSYDFKSAAMPTEDLCQTACSSNPKCDFYSFIDAAPKFKCWCGEYKKPETPMNLEELKSVEKVTLKFKKGELYLLVILKRMIMFHLGCFR